MKSLNVRTAGKIAIIAGIVASIGLLAFILFVVTMNFLWGGLGDLIGSVSNILLIPLFVVMGKMTMTNHKNPGRLVLILGVLGTLFKLTSTCLIITQALLFEEAVVWDTRGNVLLGFAVIIFVLLNRDNPILTGGYVWFSLIFGVVMANILGFLAGLFIDDLGGRTDAVFTGLLERSLNLAEVDTSVLLFMLISSPIVLIGYPIWLLWTGRLFLKSADQHSVDQ